MLKKDKIKIKNNLDDGACLYRCMADYIYDNQELKMNDKVLECIVPEHRTKNLSILEQTNIAERVQMIIVVWIINHYDLYFNELTLDEIIQATHNIDCSGRYFDIYRVFAGEGDFTYEDIGIVYKSGKKKGKPKLVRTERPNRWGGLPEIIAFSYIFGCPVQIFVLQKERKKDKKIIISNKKTKDSFFTIWAEINMEFNKIPAKFLLIEKKNAHYKYLFEE